MHSLLLIARGTWASRFFFYLIVLVMAGLCLALIPDGAFDAVNDSHILSGEWRP